MRYQFHPKTVSNLTTLMTAFATLYSEEGPTTFGVLTGHWVDVEGEPVDLSSANTWPRPCTAMHGGWQIYLGKEEGWVVIPGAEFFAGCERAVLVNGRDGIFVYD